MPVILPPGLLRAATRPALTGSMPTLNTIGVVAAASFAASTVPKLPVAPIAAAWRRPRSAQPDHRHGRLLRTRRERPRGGRTTKKRDELAALIRSPRRRARAASLAFRGRVPWRP